MLICALLAAAFGVASAMRARAEETSGRAQPVLATATSRSAWLASHLSVAWSAARWCWWRPASAKAWPMA